MSPTTVIANVTLGTEPGRSRNRFDISIEGTKITSVEPAGKIRTEGGQAIDGSDLIAFPGLINGHHHSHENFHKGRYESLPLELWMNLVRPLNPIPFTADEVYLRTMIGAIEALRTGTTTIVDDLNVSPRLDRSHVDAAFQAYEDIGIRAYVGVTLFDRPFFRGVPFVAEHFPADLLAELDSTSSTPADEILAFARDLARDHNSSDHRVGSIAAPSAPQRCTKPFLQAVRAMADEFDLPVMTHVHETRLQVITGQEFFGTSMIDYLDSIGFLKPKTSLIHGIWVTDDDLEIIARTGASIQHNPNSNLKLGSGLMPMRAMLDRGINVSLGTDGCGSIDSTDILRNMANAALLQKLREGDHNRWINARDAFEAAAIGGANALGRKDLGRIEAGAKADLALYDRASIAFTPLNDPLRQFVYAETGRGLKHLFVDGRPVIRDAALTTVDEASLIQKIHAAAEGLQRRIEDSEASVDRIKPSYERIYNRCCGEPIPETIHPTKIPRQA